jgi:DNA-binding winged helix-turn-helix (wHTH) protein
MPRTKPGLLIYYGDDGDEQRFTLTQDITTLGRSDSCAVVIPMPTVSRLHALIEIQHDRYLLSDADSANGTFVNGRQVGAGYQLATGDVVWLGSQEVALSFSDPDETLSVKNLLHVPLQIDESARVVTVYGQAVALTPLEYRLLLYLALHPGTVCTREACFLAAWGQPYEPLTCEDALNACVTKLRRNLRASAETAGMEPPQLTTIPRVGFRLDTEVAFTPRSDEPPLRERSVGG